MWTLALSVVFAGEPTCEAPATSSALTEALGAAESAYGSLDLDAFDGAMAQVRGSLSCMNEVLTPLLAASVHRLEGLDAFVTSAPTRSMPAFAAARHLDPGYRFPVSLVPEGHAVLQQYEAEHDGGGTTQSPEPRDGALHFDGAATRTRSTSLPVVFQRTDGAGAVAETRYLWPDTPLPDYKRRSEEKKAGGNRVAKIGLLAGAGAAAIGSGVLYGVAAGQAKRYDDPNTPYGDLDGLRGSTNTLVMASGGAAIVAVGAGVGGVLLGSF